MDIFKDYAYYYNMFYGDKNYAAEAKIIDDLIRKYNYNHDFEKRILNIGCGTGGHDRELLRYGYKVHGIDLSEKMIEVARKECNDITYEVQDARYLKVNNQYDLAISMFHVMSYQNSNKDFLDVLKSVNNALNLGGVFLFDAWYGPGVLTDRPSVRVKRVEDDENYITRIAVPEMHANENIVDVNYDISIVNKKSNIVNKINEVHKMRYYFKPEVEYMLQNEGFVLIDCIDCNTLKEPNYDSWTTYFIARKEH